MNNLNITIGQYVKGNSYLHKLDPRLKIVSTIILMVSIFLIPSSNLDNVYVLLGFLGFFLLVLLTARISLLAVLKGLQPIIFIGAFTFVLQIIYNKDGDLLLPLNFNFSWLSIVAAVGLLAIWYLTKKYIPIKTLYTLVMLAGVCALFAVINVNSFGSLSLPIHYDGLFKGIFFILRIVLIVVLSTLLTVSTSTTDINLGLEWVLYPFKLIKLPVSEISMMFSLTLRFIPTLLIETNKIMKAQASRGIDFNEGSLLQKVKQIITLLIPMFFISINRAEDLANAMEARGYVVGQKRTCIDELKFRVKDYIAFVIVGGILAFSIIL